MISLFGTTLGSTAPWLLVGIPIATALLVYVYRNLGTAHQAVVSTLLFLRELPQRPTSRRKFIPPFQFWIELAALSLLSLAAAGIFLSDTGNTIAVVIDLSRSMEAPTSEGPRRIEAAKRLAIADMTQSLPTTRFALFAAQSHLKPLSSSKLSGVAATSLVSPLAVTQTDDRLQTHLPQLLNGGEYDSVWVYTDRPLAASTITPNVRVVSVAEKAISRPLANLWIREASTKIVDGKTFLSLSLEQVGNETSSVIVSATCFNLQGAAQSNSRMLPETRVEAPRGVSLTAQLGPIDFPWSYCRAQVALNTPSGSDLLADDNEAWISSDAASSTIALMSPLSPEQLAIARLGGFSVVAKGSASASEGGTPQPTIIHRSVLPENPQSSTLIVFPPVGKLPWGGDVRDSESRALQISRWSDAHPVMTYVNPTMLTVSATRIIDCPPSASPILTTTAGTIACVGEQQGVRYAIIGFEIFPFDGAKTPTLSIFTLNLFKWLFESQASTKKVSPLENVTMPRGVTQVHYLAPTTDSLTISDRNTIAPPTAGVIELRDTKGGTNLVQAVNLLSDHESNLSENTPLNVTWSDTPAARPTKESFDTSPWLATLAILVLLFDLIRRIVRPSRWSRS